MLSKCSLFARLAFKNATNGNAWIYLDGGQVQFCPFAFGVAWSGGFKQARETESPPQYKYFYQLVSLCQTKQTLPADRVREEKEEPWLVLTSSLFSMPLHDPLWLSLLGHSSTTPIRYIFSSFFSFPFNLWYKYFYLHLCCSVTT